MHPVWFLVENSSNGFMVIYKKKDNRTTRISSIVQACSFNGLEDSLIWADGIFLFPNHSAWNMLRFGSRGKVWNEFHRHI